MAVSHNSKPDPLVIQEQGSFAVGGTVNAVSVMPVLSGEREGLRERKGR